MQFSVEIQDIVYMNLLFPLPIVKTFLKIVHCMCTWCGLFLYLTSYSIMSFTDSSHTQAKSIQKNLNTLNSRAKFDHAMCFGTFDIFHPGHIYYLREAEKLADTLTVIIARDARVLSGKWRLPTDDENSRLANVRDAFPAARVLLWDRDDIFAPIRDNTPDLLVFWYDQRVPVEKIREHFPTLETVRLDWYETEKYKTSLLREKN